jgi:gamma-glutamyltranspeptidase/glutathione hydrolase
MKTTSPHPQGSIDRREAVTRLAALGATPGLLALLQGCGTAPSTGTSSRATSTAPTPYRNGAVAADHPIASQAGVEILKAGGNAVDAAIAVNAMLGVVRPYSCGLGGGGFLIAYSEKTRVTWGMNAREVAPPGVWESYYTDLRSSGGPEQASRYGGHAVAVPGTASGLFHAHAQGGSLPMGQLLAPAARVARSGFEADANHLAAVASLRRTRERLPWTRSISGWVWEQWCHDGAVEVGTRLTNPALANTLERLGDEGISAWRKGEIPEALARVARSSGGKLTAQAIAGYRASACSPLVIENAFFDDCLITMPPPSSGGIAIAQILGMSEVTLMEAGLPRIPDASTSHQLVEAMKIAFGLRAEYLADPKFAPVPIEQLTDREGIRRMAEAIEADRARTAREVSDAQQLPEDRGTSHLAVIDGDRTAVAWTSTINGTFGSLVGDPVSGVILNNEMDDFTTMAGEGNLFGLRQSEWNAPEPGKCPLSSMSPSIILDGNGDIRAIAGASGGPRIISGTLQVLMGMRYWGETAAEAIARPRLHHQWMPDAVAWEPGSKAEHDADALAAKGHVFEKNSRGLGVVQAIRVEKSGFEPASDPRKGGTSAGY